MTQIEITLWQFAILTRQRRNARNMLIKFWQEEHQFNFRHNTYFPLNLWDQTPDETPPV